MAAVPRRMLLGTLALLFGGLVLAGLPRVALAHGNRLAAHLGLVTLARSGALERFPAGELGLTFGRGLLGIPDLATLEAYLDLSLTRARTGEGDAWVVTLYRTAELGCLLAADTPWLGAGAEAYLVAGIRATWAASTIEVAGAKREGSGWFTGPAAGLGVRAPLGRLSVHLQVQAEARQGKVDQRFTAGIGVGWD